MTPRAWGLLALLCVLLLLLTCCSGENPYADAIEPPGVFLTVSFDDATRLPGERALARINAATGGSLREAADGVAVAGEGHVFGLDGDEVCGGTELTWYAETKELVKVGPILIATESDVGCNSLESTILHELLHAMIGEANVHADSGVFHAVSGHGEALNEASLEAVCSRIYCPEFNPEAQE